MSVVDSDSPLREEDLREFRAIIISTETIGPCRHDRLEALGSKLLREREAYSSNASQDKELAGIAIRIHVEGFHQRLRDLLDETMLKWDSV